ncbi:phosphatidylinositol-glycan-specific phospholipase D-like isoform X2 [Eurytemora carolleeae]|uniref:phosphatidylinositol-glycan-specific phospholipase D-like isoform X2 n=1 Tax=Eurytemora carolleeae TaxID=1294199 RepID=UPI000C78580B|nr:phosphatidylinositol-glycan-specific phospholipase D-like isoform X2 [Eurytemora carolleeae]|eukprot:XP_023343667.1 phosphatidylinositol-glycan-specific phospholipase D-like isoform X2 [Eurytemora affinis]
MLLAGRLGEQVIGKLLYPEMVLTAPAMLDDLRDYFLGGLDDMATWTAIIWEQAAIAIFNGTEGCSIPENTLGFTCSENRLE